MALVVMQSFKNATLEPYYSLPSNLHKGNVHRLKDTVKGGNSFKFDKPKQAQRQDHLLLHLI